MTTRRRHVGKTTNTRETEMATLTTQRQAIETQPAFRLRCACGKRDHRWSVTPPGGQARRERLCSVCAAQLRALGYRVELVG